MKLLEPVALLTDLPEYSLVHGQVRIVIEDLAPDVFLVEFSYNEGKTGGLLPLEAKTSDLQSSLDLPWHRQSASEHPIPASLRWFILNESRNTVRLFSGAWLLLQKETPMRLISLIALLSLSLSFAQDTTGGEMTGGDMTGGDDERGRSRCRWSRKGTR